MSKNIAKEVVDGIVEDAYEQPKESVSPTHPQWVETVLDALSEHELYNGTPTTDGLRRVTEYLFGTILESQTNIIYHDPKRVVAEHCLLIRKHDTDEVIKVNACVDVLADKLPYPFNQHIVSTACTRAEGKALRRALKIRVQTAEELNTEEDVSSNEKINDQQITAIKTLCRRNNINLVKLVKKFSQAKCIDEVSNLEGRLIISKLSEFQREDIPEELVGYEADWEVKFQC